ncbi:MAG: MOSC domain-containing protein [Acidobacteria bacterium]|nr:MOSC domain-containing protein [Acidobacteriota bacterium]
MSEPWREAKNMSGVIERIFITSKGGEPMQPLAEVEAVEGRGLRGDRYLERTGYWTSVDECEVTLIEGEDLDEITSTTSLRVLHGEHRRNLVTRGIDLIELMGRRFQIGEAVLEYDRPRPPCTHIQGLTRQPGLTAALGRRGGICVRVVKSGRIRVQDPITLLDNDRT